MKLRGIHHITAIASDPQANLDFYRKILGLRFVKRTVNFDDPSSYHFYYGDRTGRPGTALTFFPWPGARRGVRGIGQVATTSFAVPGQSIEYWKDRLKEHHVLCEAKGRRFESEVLRLNDPDGLALELITSPGPDEVDLNYESAVPRDFAIRGFHAPSLEVREFGKTEALLTEVFGFEKIDETENRRRLTLNKSSPNKTVDLLERREGHFGINSAGTVHHIAFRCADQVEQEDWRGRISDFGLEATPIIDRFYFHSIYFREPGGILFEIATDGPGFTVDEPVEHLGESLRLPKVYEGQRAEIESVLPAITL